MQLSLVFRFPQNAYNCLYKNKNGNINKLFLWSGHFRIRIRILASGFSLFWLRAQFPVTNAFRLEFQLCTGIPLLRSPFSLPPFLSLLPRPFALLLPVHFLHCGRNYDDVLAEIESPPQNMLKIRQAAAARTHRGLPLILVTNQLALETVKTVKGLINKRNTEKKEALTFSFSNKFISRPWLGTEFPYRSLTTKITLKVMVKTQASMQEDLNCNRNSQKSISRRKQIAQTPIVTSFLVLPVFEFNVFLAIQ